MGGSDINIYAHTSSKSSFQTSYSSIRTAASLILALRLQQRIGGLHSNESTSFSLSIYPLRPHFHPYLPIAHHYNQSIMKTLSPTHLPGKPSALPTTSSPLPPEKLNQCLFVHIRKPEFRIKGFCSRCT